MDMDCYMDCYMDRYIDWYMDCYIDCCFGDLCACGADPLVPG